LKQICNRGCFCIVSASFFVYTTISSTVPALKIVSAIFSVKLDNKCLQLLLISQELKRATFLNQTFNFEKVRLGITD
jgi:hypothetical protein